MDTESRLVTSAPIADAAAKTLGSSLTITKLLNRVSVKTNPDTFVLEISYWDPKPSQAAAGANAFAKAYLDYKRQQAQSMIDQQQTAIESQIAELQRQQRQENQILQSHTPGTAEYRNAQDTLDQLNVQLGVLASQLASVPTAVDPGAVILPASPPSSPSSPKYPLNAAAGLFLGLFLGIGVAFLRDRTDDRVYSRADLYSYVNTPVLAAIPHLRSRARQRSAQLIVELEPRSPVAESYRTVRSNLLNMARTRDVKVLAVVSPFQREGKTITAANLAAALGRADQDVLVLSADIRKPRVHEFFGVTNNRGLADVLEGTMPIEEAIVRTGIDNVWLLPAGPAADRPAELLQSPRMSELLKFLRERFDFVLLDCPPVLGLADCLSIAPLADSVLLVVQEGNTRGGAIIEAVDQLERVGASIGAAILNDVHIPRGRPGHHGYGYYLAASDYLRPEEREARERPVRSVPSEEERTGSGSMWMDNGKAAGETVGEPTAGAGGNS
jgi:capsular exopolysaccharide synthesis family protein